MFTVITTIVTLIISLWAIYIAIKTRSDGKEQRADFLHRMSLKPKLEWSYSIDKFVENGANLNGTFSLPTVNVRAEVPITLNSRNIINISKCETGIAFHELDDQAKQIANQLFYDYGVISLGVRIVDLGGIYSAKSSISTNRYFDILTKVWNIGNSSATNLKLAVTVQNNAMTGNGVIREKSIGIFEYTGEFMALKVRIEYPEHYYGIVPILIEVFGENISDLNQLIEVNITN